MIEANDGQHERGQRPVWPEQDVLPQVVKAPGVRAVAHLLLHQAEKLLLKPAPTSKWARSSTVVTCMTSEHRHRGASSATTLGGEHGRDGALP
jgi:hypothetical protein